MGSGPAPALITAGVTLLALVPGTVTLYPAAVILGVGIGVTTPLGFAYLAATTPPERMGRTMGNAELGREAGDAGGPLLVGGIATAAGLTAGLAVLALLVCGASATCYALLRDPSPRRPARRP